MRFSAIFLIAAGALRHVRLPALRYRAAALLLSGPGAAAPGPAMPTGVQSVRESVYAERGRVYTVYNDHEDSRAGRQSANPADAARQLSCQRLSCQRLSRSGSQSQCVGWPPSVILQAAIKKTGPSRAEPAKGPDGFPMVAHPDAKGAGLRSHAQSVAGGRGRHLLRPLPLWLRKREL